MAMNVHMKATGGGQLTGGGAPAVDYVAVIEGYYKYCTHTMSFFIGQVST